MKELPLLSSGNATSSKYAYSRLKKSRKSFVSAVFVLLFFVLAQTFASLYVNLNTVYHYRINYDMFLKNQKTIEVVLDEMAKTIKDKELTDYIILIGNSVAWGTNESSEHSLGRYLNDEASQGGAGEAQTVFNLSLPSIQAGDAYALLLMLEERGIKTDNVMLGLTYSAFSKREPGPKAVFWLADYLRQEDPEAFNDVLPHLLKNRYDYKTGWKHAEERLLDKTLGSMPAVKYADPLMAYAEQMRKGTDLLGDPRPWHEKKYSEKRLNDPQYLNFFKPEPFDMTEANWGVYFMDRIAKHQEGKRTLVFVAGGNAKLSKKEIGNPGYQANLRKVESYLSGKPFDYLMLENRIDADLYTDHIHLTKEGNQLLARLIWDSWKREAA